jgi:hypothetical protein
MEDITVILNVYNRPYTLESQLLAIKNQTVKVEDENIWVWYNRGTVKQATPKNPAHRIFVCNQNTKFHGRFAAAMLAQTEYVALLDDDVIPGTKWFENCLESMKVNEGVMGGSGVHLYSSTAYQPNHKVGWNGYHHSTVTRVDLVGHAWFFKKEWLKYMWMENPVSWDNGEDIMFSYLCQKYGNINTFVPPHPENDQELWGNVPGRDNHWGVDQNATWLHSPTHFSIRDNVVKTCVENGWKIINGK